MNPLRCEEVKNSLVEYLEFELPMTQREKFYEHLAQCSQCRAAHDELQQVLSEVKDIDVVYPAESYWDDLSENILNEVKHLRPINAPNSQNHSENDSSTRSIPGRDDSDNDNKVIVFPEIKSRKISEPVVSYENNDKDYTRQIIQSGKAQESARRWPKFALPIAAAILIGVATTFSLIEDKTVIQDNIGFQAKIQSEQSLAELASRITPLSQKGNQFGFVAQKVLFNEFSIGSLFSEAKVYAATGQAVELKTYLALLKTALQRESNPQYNIINGVSQLQLQLEAKNDFVQVNKRLTGLLNDYVAAIKVQDERRYNLARAGAWLFDYALAAVAQDEVRIKQLDRLRELTTALQAAGAPPGVVKSLKQIQEIASQPGITIHEYQQVLEAVENIRSLLG
ncbi:zf-HC2 domain-containing protein [Kaarinaea lacus]